MDDGVCQLLTAAASALLQCHEHGAGAGLLEQVKHTVACQLVTPRRIVPGMLRITTLQIRFSGDPEEAGDPTHPKVYVALLPQTPSLRNAVSVHACEGCFTPFGPYHVLWQ